MQRSYSNSNTTQNWEAEIQDYQKELQQHGHEMSAYERNTISRMIKARQDELIPKVGAIVIGEWKSAINNYKNAQAQIDAERTKEINRFDSAKFNAELQTINTRVNLALRADVNELKNDPKPSAKIAAIYSEAIQSGDLHKQRAAVEVIKSLPLPTLQSERIAMNQMIQNAAAAEQSLRQTEGTIKAQQQAAQALNDIAAKKEKLNKVSQVLGMGSIDDVFSTSPFAKAARLVERDRTTGEIVIRSEDDPEITGVYWGKEELTK